MHYLNFNAPVVFFCVLLLKVSASAFPIYWTGSSGDGLWSTPGNWATGSVPHDTAYVQFNASSSNNCTLDIDVHLDTLQLTTEYTGRFVMRKKLHIRKKLEFSKVECISVTMSDTLVFTGNGTQNITGKPGFIYPVIVKEGTGTLAVVTTGFRSHGFILKNGILHNTTAFNDTVGNFVCTGGQLSLNAGSIRISGDANFEGIQDFTDNSGSIYLSSIAPQNLIPNPDVILPKINARSYQLHINGNRLRTSKLTVDSGMVILGTAISTDSLNVNYEGTFAFDPGGNQKDTIGVINGTGALIFGNTELCITGDADFTSFDTLYGTASIELYPVMNSVFRSKDNFVFDKIKKAGTSTTTVENSSLRIRNFSVDGGTFDWGTSYNDTIYDTLFLKNAVMNMGNNSVMFRSLIDSNSTINFNYGLLERFGNDGVIDLGAAQHFSYMYQGLSLRGSTGATTKIIPPSNCTIPPVQVNDSGLIEVTGDFNGSSVMINSGSWNWGTGFTHAVRGMSVYGGKMIFGNSVIVMDSGNLHIGYAAEIIKGTAKIVLDARFVPQTIYSESDSVLPNILKTDSSELMINSQLKCLSFTQTAGKTRFSGFGIKADSTIVFENVDSLINIGGITLQAGKSITFSGTAGKPLYCNPESEWFVNATSTLQAFDVVLKNCVASDAPGVANISSVDSGGNSNWTFQDDVFPPDNDLTMQLTAIDTGRVHISWNPSVIDSTDAMQIGIRYSTTNMPESMNDQNSILLDYYPLTDSVDTVLNLNAHTTYYFAAAVSDSSGNWSEMTTRASGSIRTKTIAPQVIDPPDTIRSRELKLSWVNPPGLSFQDGVFIHVTDVGDSSSKVYAKFSSQTTTSTVLLPLREGLYKYILSTSHDSAGLYYPDDAYIDSVRFIINPPVMILPEDTFYNFNPVISWTAPEGFTASDTIFIYIDSVNGAGSWVLNAWYTGETTSHQFSFSETGTYKIMLSSNRDKTGLINQDNIVIDTLYIVQPDTEPPRLSVNISNNTVLKQMPSEISGTAYDTLSGILSASILICKMRDTTYWSGSSWHRSIFWIPLPNLGTWSYSTSGMNCDEGNYLIKIGATDSSGNIGYDTTYITIDTSAPVVTMIFDNVDTVGSWTGLISGEAVDSFSMVRNISVSIKNDSGKFFDGSSWSTKEYFHDCNGTNTWFLQINTVHLPRGNYTVSIIATDTVGNISVSPVMKTFGYYTGTDSLSEKVTSHLFAAAINCSTAAFNWNKPSPVNSDSILLVLSGSGFPLSADSGEYRYTIAINDTVLTITHLPPSGVTIYSRLFLKNSTGEVFIASDSSNAVVTVLDCEAPLNHVLTAISKTGDSLVTFRFKTEDMDTVRIMAGVGISKESALTNRIIFSNNDTSITIRAVIPGYYYCAAATIDNAGNISPFKFDSIAIINSAPKLHSSGDTVVTEGITLIRQILASDLNNDSLFFSLKSPKNGMSLDKNVFKWMPRNSDAGLNEVVIECKDIRGAASFDTFTVTVVNVSEPPEVSYEGVYEVYEDSSYSGVITVFDPDMYDTVTTRIVRLPAWMTISNNKLTGVPANKYVGVNHVELIYTDRDSLRDTLAFQIMVINTNDKPVVIEGTLPDTLIEKEKYSVNIKIKDDDGDSVKVKNWISKSWIAINSVKATEKVNEWVASVTFSPVQKDTGLHEVKFEISDRYGGVTYHAKKIRVIDADDPPEKPVLTRKTATGALQYTVRATDDRDNLLIYSVKMKSLRNDSVIYTDSSVRSLHLLYPLSDGKYSFSAFAVDASGLKSAEAADTVIITGSSQHVFKDTNWEMAAVPSKSFNAEKFKNSNYLLHWDESGTEKQVFSFYKQKKDISIIEPSKAYWRKGKSGDTITLSTSDFINEPVVINLHKTESGWNQISSPFPYPVAWSRKTDILWKWNSGTNDYEEVQNVLEPWCGYWVCADSSAKVTLSPLPVFSSGSLAKLRKTFYLNKNNWMFQVSLRTSGGNDIDNKFGLNQNASDQFDDFDRPEPPGIEGRPVLYFKNDAWKNSSRNELASDIRKNWKTVNIFEFALEGTKVKETGTLNFSGLENGTGLYVFTKIGDSIFQVEQSQSYSVSLTKDVSYQTVFVTDNPGFLNSFPLHFKMGNPYPNPFCLSTRINYTLPYRWGSDGRINLNHYKVSIEIFDIMGRKLKTLVYRKMVPGNYSLMWDGKMQNGRIAASGKYYCVLKADNLRHNQNLTLIK